MADLVILALAINQIVEVWRHSRAPWVVRCRMWAESQPGSLFWWYAECPWCASVGLGLLVTTFYCLEKFFFGDGVARWLALALAASRLANWINDFNYELWRTPGRRFHEKGIETERTEEAKADATGGGLGGEAAPVSGDRSE